MASTEQKELEIFWASRKETTVQSALESIDLLESELSQALSDLELWRSKLENNPSIETLQKVGMFNRIERSPLGSATLQMIKEISVVRSIG
jgi:hypothetical protein